MFRGHRETKAAAARPGGIRLREPLEEALEITGRRARAVILDGDDDRPATVRRSGHAHRRPGACSRALSSRFRRSCRNRRGSVSITRVSPGRRRRRPAACSRRSARRRPTASTVVRATCSAPASNRESSIKVLDQAAQPAHVGDQELRRAMSARREIRQAFGSTDASARAPSVGSEARAPRQRRSAGCPPPSPAGVR